MSVTQEFTNSDFEHASATFNVKADLVHTLTDLTASLAANATAVIETDPDAFEYVEERTGHSGARTRKIDFEQTIHTAQYIEVNSVRTNVPGPLHLQTEETRTPFHKAAFKGVGIHLDEFDGTTNAYATCAAWSVAGLVFHWSDRYQKHVLYGGSIALCDGHGISFINKTGHRRDGRSRDPYAADLRWWKWDTYSPFSINSGSKVAVRHLGELPEPPQDGDPDVVVVNAAGQKRFLDVVTRYPRLLQDTSFRGLTAGTPIVYAAARGAVGAIVDPGESTLHDSTHLFVLASLGWRILSLDGLVEVDLVNLAEQAALGPGDQKVFPPNIAVRNDDALKYLAP